MVQYTIVLYYIRHDRVFLVKIIPTRNRTVQYERHPPPSRHLSPIPWNRPSALCILTMRLVDIYIIFYYLLLNV